MNLNKILTGLAASAALVLVAGPAQADTYLFTLSGASDASWELDSSPSVPYTDSDFQFQDVPVTFAGSTTGTTSSSIAFFTSGTFLLLGGALPILANGPQLFTGDVSSPTFKLGTFSLTNLIGSPDYSLNVADVSAVPEPANAALLLGGLGLIGTIAARRRRFGSNAL
jgi:hypothetical protein